MGLDAHVYCNCLKDGKAKPLPKGVSIEFDEGFYYMYKDGKELSYDYVDKYLETACEHPNMCLFDDRIGNVSGLNNFYSILNSVNKKFHTLETLFNKGDNIPYETVLKANEELQELKELIPTLTGTYLININNNQVEQYILGNEKYRFSFNHDYVMMLYNNNFHIINRITEEILFSSDNFKVYPQEFNNLFEDIKTKNTLKCQISIHYNVNNDIVQYKVINKKVSIKDCYIIDVLQRCFNASIESKNPIWFG